MHFSPGDTCSHCTPSFINAITRPLQLDHPAMRAQINYSDPVNPEHRVMLPLLENGRRCGRVIRVLFTHAEDSGIKRACERVGYLTDCLSKFPSLMFGFISYLRHSSGKQHNRLKKKQFWLVSAVSTFRLRTRPKLIINRSLGKGTMCQGNFLPPSVLLYLHENRSLGKGTMCQGNFLPPSVLSYFHESRSLGKGTMSQGNFLPPSVLSYFHESSVGGRSLRSSWADDLVSSSLAGGGGGGASAAMAVNCLVAVSVMPKSQTTSMSSSGDEISILARSRSLSKPTSMRRKWESVWIVFTREKPVLVRHTINTYNWDAIVAGKLS